jgi:hypothetical protein
MTASKECCPPVAIFERKKELVKKIQDLIPLRGIEAVRAVRRNHEPKSERIRAMVDSEFKSKRTN